MNDEQTVTVTKLSNSGIWVVLLLLATALAGAVYIYWPIVSKKLSESQDVSQRVDVLESKIEENERRISELSGNVYRAEQLAGNSGSEHRTSLPNEDDISARLDALEEKLSQSGGTSLPAADMEGLKTRIATLEQSATPAGLGEDVRKLMESNRALQERLRLFAGLRQIERKIEAGQTFTEELIPLMPIARPKERELLTALEVYSSRNILSADKLKSELTLAARQWNSSRSVATKTNNWQDKLKSNVSQLVSIRRTDAPENDKSDEAVIARAEKFLSQKQLSQAIKEIKSLSTKAAPYFKDWRISAEQNLATDNLLLQLENSLWQENQA